MGNERCAAAVAAATTTRRLGISKSGMHDCDTLPVRRTRRDFQVRVLSQVPEPWRAPRCTRKTSKNSDPKFHLYPLNKTKLQPHTNSPQISIRDVFHASHPGLQASVMVSDDTTPKLIDFDLIR